MWITKLKNSYLRPSISSRFAPAALKSFELQIVEIPYLHIKAALDEGQGIIHNQNQFGKKLYSGQMTKAHGTQAMQIITAEKAKSLPLASLAILTLHNLGVNVREQVSPNTYYSHKRILEAAGYDINTKPNKKTRRTPLKK